MADEPIAEFVKHLQLKINYIINIDAIGRELVNSASHSIGNH